MLVLYGPFTFEQLDQCTPIVLELSVQSRELTGPLNLPTAVQCNHFSVTGYRI